ncbi:hypothetical protein [Bacillus thuringiensis]|uniref:hypothetical protein n=1 Tax=Bacillus thuringiensis TaxID=1428 RepID=UPI0026E1C9D4|nr:hypothetical protein [Bacillus thuringiensis]MDO6634117.1 hypothetical protein [Bacillus thuringiensis]MDO6663552.1 hypothetical protein [Bacillus thuringiensis]MDO6704275.1 hypothetical protein [Bacillus thuringiensis]
MENMHIAVNAKIKGLERAKVLLEELNSLQLELVVESPKEIEGNIPIDLEVTLDGRAIAEGLYSPQSIPLDTRVREIMRMLEGLTYMQWQTIEREVNHEYKRLANKNTLRTRESMLKNILQDVDSSTVGREMK